MKESKIQARVRRILEDDGWLVNKLILTSKPGTPDLIAHKDGRTIYIEVKRPGERPRPLQTHRMEQIRRQGIEVYTIDDPNELQSIG